jgi:hypothetical protein
MLRAMTRSQQTLFLGLVAAVGMNCSVNRSGLSPDKAGPDGGAGTGGSGTALGTGGSGIAGGTGGAGATLGTGGAGVVPGTGGDDKGGRGSGGAGTGGASAGAGTGGSASGGSASGSGGSGSGGLGGTAVVATGGAGGGGVGGRPAGLGGTGAPSTGGPGGSLGSGGLGAGGQAACGAYPGARVFVTPDDNRAHCYWVHSDLQGWPAAETVCESEKGRLATVTSSPENVFVLGVASSTIFSAPPFWLGGTDDRDAWDMSGYGPYRWITDESFSYLNWATGQPNGRCDSCSSAAESCHCDHRIVMGADGTWSDWWQDTPCGFVCEAIP